MKPTTTKRVRVTKHVNVLNPGFRVERTPNVPSIHRIPGFNCVVMGPNITGGPGEGSYGSGNTPQEAIDAAARLQRDL